MAGAGETPLRAAVREPGSTLPEPADPRRMRRARGIRRLALTALVVFLAAGVAGAFGVRTTTATAASGGWELSVVHAAVTRPGLATPWEARVRSAGGFSGPVAIGVSRRYLEMLDVNGVHPEPAEMTAQDGLVVWEFDPPDGETLTVTLDARTAPSSLAGREATTVLIVDGRPVTGVRYRTRIMP